MRKRDEAGFVIKCILTSFNQPEKSRAKSKFSASIDLHTIFHN